MGAFPRLRVNTVCFIDLSVFFDGIPQVPGDIFDHSRIAAARSLLRLQVMFPHSHLFLGRSLGVAL